RARGAGRRVAASCRVGAAPPRSRFHLQGRSVSPDAPIEAGPGGDAARESLAIVEAAAVAMLEPLMLEPAADGSPAWVAAMAQRSAALGKHARSLGLEGIALVAELVRDQLLAADRAAAAPDVALAGQWASGLIAFVGLQLDAEGRR